MKKESLLIFLLVFCYGKHEAQYYNTAFGLNGAPLKAALHNITKNHNTQSWPLWSYFYTTDVKDVNMVWDIYSDVPGGVAPYAFTLGTNQCGTYNQESDCYNHEHTWPSTFFNDATPIRTDLHHVFATDGYVNNKRSNYPYGIVSNASWTSQNGSKLGNGSTYNGYTDKLFEPVDSFKGDLARTYFYMSTRYFGEDAGWTNWTMANGAELTPEAIALLLDWHQKDPVSQKEINRNNAIYQIQNNRNPFIDYPLFADCIWGNGDCTSIGITDRTKTNTLKLYPIPATDEIKIDLERYATLLNWVIYDIVGMEMMRKTIFQPFGKSESIPVSQLRNGHYLIVINTTAGISKNIFEKR